MYREGFLKRKNPVFIDTTKKCILVHALKALCRALFYLFDASSKTGNDKDLICMEHLTDQELIAAYARGEEHAFDVLVSRYLQGIYRFLLRLVREKELAEDLSQETFVRAWKKFETFDQARSFKSWLFAIARYAAFDALKKKQPLRFSELTRGETSEEGLETSIVDDRPSPHELMLMQEQKGQVEHLLAELPLSAQEVLLLHDDEDLTFQEIATTIKEPLNTVKSRYRRALLLLRKNLLRKATKDRFSEEE